MKLTAEELVSMNNEREAYRRVVDEALRHRACVVEQGVELICIGNAGGASSQVHGRPSGGFLLRSACRNILVDPGNNAMSEIVRLGLDPYDITDVLASHAHSDHVGDLTTAVSAAVRLGLRQQADANIIVSPDLIDYSNERSTCFGFTLPTFAWNGRVVPLYWAESAVGMADGSELHSSRTTTLGDDIAIKSTRARHGQVKVTGFVIDTPGGRLGYTSDTEYFEGLAGEYRDCDLLWMNMNTLGIESLSDTDEAAFNAAEPVNNHLGYVGVCRLIDEVQPSTAIVSHFGNQLVEHRAAVESMMRKRFNDRPVAIYCPANGDSWFFGKRLSDKPVTRSLAP